MCTRVQSKRTTLLQKREELQRQIRELGSLPSNAFDKYKGKAVKDLHRALQQCHEAIKKFSHVNKKALDQFLQFTEQREDLSRRHEEVETSKTKIAELVEGLDRCVCRWCGVLLLDRGCRSTCNLPVFCNEGVDWA